MRPSAGRQAEGPEACAIQEVRCSRGGSARSRSLRPGGSSRRSGAADSAESRSGRRSRCRGSVRRWGALRADLEGTGSERLLQALHLDRGCWSMRPVLPRRGGAAHPPYARRLRQGLGDMCALPGPDEVEPADRRVQLRGILGLGRRGAFAPPLVPLPGLHAAGENDSG